MDPSLQVSLAPNATFQDTLVIAREGFGEKSNASKKPHDDGGVMSFQYVG